MKKIFQFWLFLFVLMAFVITLVLSYKIHSSLARTAAKELLRVKLDDAARQVVKARENLDIISEISNQAVLAKTRALASIVAESPEILNDLPKLKKLCKDLDVDELHISDENGILIASIPENYIGYNMADSSQSAEFLLALKDPNFEYVQSPRDNGIEKKFFQYTGVARRDQAGIVQVGIHPKKIEEAMKVADIEYISSVFRIGKTGTLKIFKNSGDTGEATLNSRNEVTKFSKSESGEETFSMGVTYGDYRLIGTLPKAEMYVSRDSIIQILVIGNLVLFGVIFMLISHLLQKVVIRGIHSVNSSLSQIQDGNLEEQVKVSNTSEFIALSQGINSTVEALKQAIAAEAKRIDAELEVGRTIQYSVLPNEFPVNENYELYATMNTAKEVGGDFFDFFMVDEEHLAVMIADVSGKGITAALYMMTAKTMLKELTLSGKSPAEVFTVANQEIGRNNPAKMFLSAFLGILNLKTGEMICANAGHNPPLIKKDNTPWEYLKIKHSVVLGISKKARYSNVIVNLNSKDKLMLYTDGVTEAMNPQAQLYGEVALAKFMNNASGTPKEILNNLTIELENYADGTEQSDDITMLLLSLNKFKN